VELKVATLSLDDALKRVCTAALTASADFPAAASRLGLTRAALARYLDQFELTWPPAASALDESSDDDAQVFEVTTFAETERALCLCALTRAATVTSAAELLGISEYALRRRMIVHRLSADPLPER
jgi:DNA-binding protein Fis